MIENSTPDTSGTRSGVTPSRADVERQHRAEAAVDELQPEDHGHQQHEVLERQHVPERDRVRRRASPVGLPRCAARSASIGS